MHDFIQYNKDECWSLETYRSLYYVNHDMKNNSVQVLQIHNNKYALYSIGTLYNL